jgi:hypothetical protein
VDYTATGIIDRVKRSFAASDNDPNFTQANIVAYINDELYGTIVPIIAKLSEEYFVTYLDTAIVSSQDTYDLPSAAVAQGLQDVNIIEYDTSGLETMARITQVPHIQPDMQAYHASGYFLRNNKLVLLNPDNYTGKYLRMYYARRPNEIVVETDAREIVSVAGNVASIASTPSAWTSAQEYCVVGGNPPFNTILAAQTVTVSGTDLTFTSLNGVSVGDWIALDGQSPIPQIPFDCFPLLAQAVTVRITEALDRTALPTAQARFAMLRDNIQNVLVNRVQTDPVRMVRNDDFLQYL